MHIKLLELEKFRNRIRYISLSKKGKYNLEYDTTETHAIEGKIGDRKRYF